MSKIVVHKADSRGIGDHGWLYSRHTFSFADYYDPTRVNFGVLRVLNDDYVEGGMGFGTHPHNNMEIISIPLEGDLEHRDSMGNISVIKEGDIQVMSAGTGITHSEYNKNSDRPVKFLQIWLFPCTTNLTPRYDQITLPSNEERNTLKQVLSPNSDDEGVWIHQDAWFHTANLDSGVTVDYSIKKSGNGVYIFVIEGSVEVEGKLLSRRDGMGIEGANSIKITSCSADTKVLVMDVPM